MSSNTISFLLWFSFIWPDPTPKISCFLTQIYTFPTPEQFGHLRVAGAFKGRSDALDTEMGSMLKHTPLAEHRAQGKYPVYK